MTALFVHADRATALALDCAMRQSLPLPDDGQRLELRPVQGSDAALLADFVADLSPLSRRRRFHSGIRTLPSTWLDRLLHTDPAAEYALLALASADGRSTCVGEARYALSDEASDAREFALVVADGWQGQGVGSRLLRTLACHARAHGVARLYGDVLRDNAPMLGMVQRLGYALLRHPSDATLVRVERVLDGSLPDREDFADGAGVGGLRARPARLPCC
jgi:GNAT superfamily N-acetyltransferase